MRRRIRILVVAALLATAGCDNSGTTSVPATAPGPASLPAPVPTTLTATPETVELSSPGAAGQLSAEVRDQAGRIMTGVSVAWASSDARTARVDEMGSSR